MKRVCFIAALCGAISLGVSRPGELWAQQRVTFLGVALDAQTREADRRLIDHLSRRTGVTFAHEELEYERMINRLVSWRPADGTFVARTTPYVYVAAELLGADVEPFATYVSAATSKTTYHSYLVVNRREFPSRPSIDEVVRFVRDRTPRARFVYHSQFSASSYLLPLLLFRSSNVFHMPESTGPLSAIAAIRLQDAGSSTLVQMVARGEADVAAVWDDTKARFEAPGHAEGGDVHFVQLPTSIPNDLLVSARGLDAETRKRLLEAVRGMGARDIAAGDFLTWTTLADASEARTALANLRWVARERPSPVPIEIVMKDGLLDSAGTLRDSAREAVRLSGTEFVLFDADYHEHVDVRWTLEPSHDESVTLISSVPGADIEPQTFRISFRDPQDLTRRLVGILQSRMHRIRYVWPFSGHAPVVPRDIAFPAVAGAHVKVQAVTWIDPARNRFRGGPVFSAAIREASAYRYELDPGDFVKASGAPPSLDPMSNSGYRVILLRPAEERTLFKALTVALLACYLLAAAAAIVEVVRRRRRQTKPDSARAGLSPVA